MPMPVAWRAGYEWGIDPDKHPHNTIETFAEKNGIEFGTPEYSLFLRGVEAAQDELDDM